tara:strand:- start:2783 stop:3313 length:531 start_codon:yes stop_codon:yes gene_type:complete
MLYTDLTKNLQDKIKDKIKKNIKIYVTKNILPHIINYRKKYFREFILFDPTYFRIDLYYFLNLDFYKYKQNEHQEAFNIKTKFIDFLYNLLPETVIINHNQITDLYNEYYKQIEISNFINKCIDILSVSDLEIYYIYLIIPGKFDYYLNVNTLPIFISKEYKIYNEKYIYYKGIKT